MDGRHLDDLDLVEPGTEEAAVDSVVDEKASDLLEESAHLLLAPLGQIARNLIERQVFPPVGHVRLGLRLHQLAHQPRAFQLLRVLARLLPLGLRGVERHGARPVLETLVKAVIQIVRTVARGRVRAAPLLEGGLVTDQRKVVERRRRPHEPRHHDAWPHAHDAVERRAAVEPTGGGDRHGLIRSARRGGNRGVRRGRRVPGRQIFARALSPRGLSVGGDDLHDAIEQGHV
mmetsp:Transcript_64436/g.178569  ORF Transcript_64436/g.178569 Transcript_64436/m.178569 type:complete len:231 (+) Transcript_64436:2003-2695(+)